MATRDDLRVIRQAGDRQVCIHAVTGRAPESKMCANGYDCGTCPYDQMLEDTAGMMTPATQKGAAIVKAA